MSGCLTKRLPPELGLLPQFKRLSIYGNPLLALATGSFRTGKQIRDYLAKQK